MKLLLMLFIAAATVALTTAFITLGSAGGTTAGPGQAPSVQKATLQIVNDHDAMLGQYEVLHPGPVELTIINYAHHAHTFSVPMLGIEKAVLPATKAAPTITVVRFRVPAGTFQWLCRLRCKGAMSGDIYAMQNPPMMHSPLWTGS